MTTKSASVSICAAALLFTCASCTDDAQRTEPCTPTTDAIECSDRSVTPDDLNILSAVVSFVQDEGPCTTRPGDSQVKLIERTIDADDARMDMILFSLGPAHSESFQCDTLEDLVCRNRTEYELSDILPTDDLVSSDVLSNPADYIDQNPDVMSILRLSLPGIDHRNTEALIYFERWCAGLQADAGLVLLERVDSQWRIVTHFPLWIS